MTLKTVPPCSKCLFPQRVPKLLCGPGSRTTTPVGHRTPVVGSPPRSVADSGFRHPYGKTPLLFSVSFSFSFVFGRREDGESSWQSLHALKHLRQVLTQQPLTCLHSPDGRLRNVDLESDLSIDLGEPSI